MKRWQFTLAILLLSVAVVYAQARGFTMRGVVRLPATQTPNSGGGGGGGSVAITFVASGSQGVAASGNISPGLPSGIQTGDILICAWHNGSVATATMSGDWTEVLQGNGGGTSSRLAVFWCRYNSASPPSTTVTSGTGNSVVAGISAFRNCKTSGSPVNVAGASMSSGTSVNIDVAGVTTTVNNCMLLVCDGSGNDNDRTPPAGFTAAFPNGGQNSYMTSLGSPDTSVAVHYKIVSTGSTGTQRDVQSLSNTYAGVQVALEPQNP